MAGTDRPAPTALNAGQQRKIRIIEKTFGPGWQDTYPGMAIDAIYNLAIQDDRRPLFCKIDKNRKARLAAMLDEYGVTMGEFIEKMIDAYYERFALQQQSRLIDIAEDYSGE